MSHEQGNEGNGQFEFASEKDGKHMLQHAHATITKLQMWEWFRNITPHRPFSMCKDPHMLILIDEMLKDPIGRSHTGTSAEWTFIQMKLIADKGYDTYREMWIEHNRPVKRCMRMFSAPKWRWKLRKTKVGIAGSQ